MTHSPSRPMAGACMTPAQILCSILSMSKKLRTIATPILEKLTVANIREAPSDSPGYSPQRLASLSRKRAQLAIQRMKAMMTKTKMRMTCNESMRRMQPRREEWGERKTCVSLIRRMMERRLMMMAKILLKMGRILQYQSSSFWPVLRTRDLRGVCFSMDYKTSAQNKACFTQSPKDFSCLRHLAMALLMSLLCSIAFSKVKGQLSRYPVVFSTFQQWLLWYLFNWAGTISSAAWQYWWISSQPVLFFSSRMQAATRLYSSMLYSTSCSVQVTRLWRYQRQVPGSAFLHMVLGTSTSPYPIRPIRSSMPQMVARHFRKVISPISPPAFNKTSTTNPTTAPTSIHRQKIPLDFRLRFNLSPLEKSPASYHSCRTGMMVHVSRQTDQYRTRYCMPMPWTMSGLGRVCRVWQTSQGTRRARPKLRTQVRTDQNLTWRETQREEQELTRQMQTRESSPYWRSSYSITIIIQLGKVRARVGKEQG